ncbi:MULTISPECIES: Gfo/Idh/MocA family protein [Actinoalloteichus]|uniref:Oxidoreductase family, C-terminal alpha/beta domain n=1 Tax=Actinoalloteichus caeruleus DSM 43889 TaxID=1120930 RepID=A0ABT1JMT5_ACTCY|nr:Gfo/Idh/MocA family oxidoreductase [Actinoalloteichus caeruleus]MCP2333845.1 Oxidoreductase family, C-terminal alpha/beta domain [Actinoalloteichus caeruleus DSM 43889]
MSDGNQRTRYALVGLGSRAEMYVNALASGFPDTAELVALCDSNQTRIAAYNGWLTDAGHPALPAYTPDRFEEMLTAERVDAVIVCTTDSAHDHYLVSAMNNGRRAITEKPMTVDVAKCRAILDTQRRTGVPVEVTFNYRYNPVHQRVRELLADDTVGRVGSVTFEWLLDVQHGADYFRRWHREREHSGGLLVHKSSHHFDLVNWWLDDRPELVFGMGRLFFYGESNGARHGLARDYARAAGSEEARSDPFALDLAASPRMRALYLDAEHEDGYLRDRNVFGSGITVEDDMSVLARYRSGVSLNYQLHAYSPYEGYRVCFNGSGGRLELAVRENDYARSPVEDGFRLERPPGTDAADFTRATITRYPLFAEPEVLLDEPLEPGHGGGDELMLRALFGPPAADPLGLRADHVAGANALAVGLAATESFRTGAPVRVSDLLPL